MKHYGTIAMKTTTRTFGRRSRMTDMGDVARGGSSAFPTDPRTGLPLVSVGTAVTSEDVRSLEDVE